MSLPTPALPALQGDLQVDCAIIGGGFTGLNAARHLMRKGVQACVLEANDVGWGASGRNGGMVVLRYKEGWHTLAKGLGTEATTQLYRMVHRAVDRIEENVAEFGIDGGFSRCGHITAANTRANARSLQDDVSWLRAAVGDTGPGFLTAESMRQHLGTEAYCGGYLDPRAGALSPLPYTRELAAALHGRGLPIYVGTPVQRMDPHARGCTLTTPGGRVEARTVIVATNAYSDGPTLTRSLHRRIVPVNTSVIATEELPEDLYNRIIPGGQMVTDTRHLVNYFRRLPKRRLLYGGRGSLTRTEHPRIYRGLEESLKRTYPILRDARIEYQWSGRVAVTLDDFPHVGQYAPHVFYACGYGGRGVALSHLLGELAAELATGARVQAGPMAAPLGNIPLHEWRLPILNLAALCFKMRDALKV